MLYRGYTESNEESKKLEDYLYVTADTLSQSRGNKQANNFMLMQVWRS